MSPVLFETAGGIFVAKAPQVDDLSLVFHLNLVIFALFGLFSILTLPRFFTRFSRGSEWTTGLFLYSRPRSSTPKSKYVVSVPLESVSHKATFSGSDDSHTLNSHTHLIRRAADEKGRKLSLPPHMKSWTGRYHRISAFLDRECVPSYSIGRSVIVAGYFLVLLYASVYKSSPFSDPLRTGFVAMSQIPLVFALATKNNVLGMMLAVGYEKVYQ
jgi:ferric-chelate reductase